MGKITLHVALILIHNSCKSIYPRNMVGYRYIIVNTLHKGDNKGDDNHHHHHDTIICGHRTAATLYTLQTWFVLGI